MPSIAINDDVHVFHRDTLLVLDQRGDRILAVDPRTGRRADALSGVDEQPDGIAVDPAHRTVYWTNMGRDDMAPTGSVDRWRVGEPDVRRIVGRGATFTAKQIQLDRVGRRVYWCDREGMKIWSARTDGSDQRLLVSTGAGPTDRDDARRWCVGIAVDVKGGWLYWTQKGPTDGGVGRVLRARLDPPAGADPAHRPDVETLFDGLPEPIDLELDLDRGLVYWTDRGSLPGGNSVHVAPIPAPGERGGQARLLFDGMEDAIGIAFAPDRSRLFVADIGGNVWSADRDGGDVRRIVEHDGRFTGIAYAPAAG